jgi:hypothetical protein
MSGRRTRLDNSLDNVQDKPGHVLDNSLDIAEAAARLGLSPETVRKRLQRGKIKGFKLASGAWRVVLPGVDSGQDKPGHGPDNVLDKTGQHTERIADGAVTMAAALREEIAFLRSQVQAKDTQLAARDEEIRRVHILLQQAQQNAAALLPAPSVPWWRRWLGLG